MERSTTWTRERIRITGIIVPADWDSKGHVVKLAIMTADEGEYTVDEIGKGKELVDFIRQKLEVTGVVREEAGQRIITIEDYKWTG